MFDPCSKGDKKNACLFLTYPSKVLKIHSFMVDTEGAGFSSKTLTI